MSAYTGGSPVNAELVAKRLIGATEAAKADGAFGFAAACRQGAAALTELRLENDRLRKLLDEAEAKLGLR